MNTSTDKAEPEAPRRAPLLLVTGASGLLGSNFIPAAAPHFQVMGCCGRHRCCWPNAGTVSVDLTARAEVDSMLTDVQPDVIVHLAAATNVDRCEQIPAEAHALNVAVTERLARFAAEHGKRFVLMSTDSVFDGVRGGYTEGDAPNPVNQYARSKLEAERVVSQSVPAHLIVRANIYGWNAQPKLSLAEWVLQRLQAGQQVPGFTDSIFAPLLVNSLAEIILELLRKNAHGLVHVASRESVSKFDFAVLLARRFGYPASQVQQSSTAGANFIARRPANTSLQAVRLQNEFGITPPTIGEDIVRFRKLRDSGYVDALKATYLP